MVKSAEYSVTWAIRRSRPEAIGRAASGGGFDRASQGHAVTDQLIEIRCSTRDLGDCPVSDGGAQRYYVHLMEEVAERGIRWRSPQLKAQRIGEHGVVADGETFQIPQALAAAQYPEQRNQQHSPLRLADHPAHPAVLQRLEEADQIGCGCGAFGHREEAIPPTSTLARSPGKKACDGL